MSRPMSPVEGIESTQYMPIFDGQDVMVQPYADGRTPHMFDMSSVNDSLEDMEATQYMPKFDAQENCYRHGNPHE